jgi:hypothetical protein
VYGRGGRKTVEVKVVDGKWTEAAFHACHGLPGLTRVGNTGGSTLLGTSGSAQCLLSRAGSAPPQPPGPPQPVRRCSSSSIPGSGLSFAESL